MHWEKASNLGVRFSQKYNVVLVGICIRWLVAPSFSYTYSSLSILATIHTFCQFFDMIARLASVSLTVSLSSGCVLSGCGAAYRYTYLSLASGHAKIVSTFAAACTWGSSVERHSYGRTSVNKSFHCDLISNITQASKKNTVESDFLVASAMPRSCKHAASSTQCSKD
jgi:hypothetical protein